MKKPTNPSRNDAALVKRALADDAGAFEELVLRHQRRAFAIARSQGVAPEALDDVVQEAFLRSFRSLRALRSPGKFGPWLLHIVRNAAIDHLKKQGKVRYKASLDEPRSEEGDAAEATDFDEYLWRAVARLPRGVREAIFLYYHDGESTRAVAGSLEISVSAVKSRLERGRQLLREELWHEMEKCFRDILPPEREWRRKGRYLALVAMLSMPPGLVTRSAAAAGLAEAAPGGVTGGTSGAASVGASGGAAGGASVAKRILAKLFGGTAVGSGKATILGLALLATLGGLSLIAESLRPKEADDAAPPRAAAVAGAPRTLEPPAGADLEAAPEPARAAIQPAISGLVFLEERGRAASGASVAAFREGEDRPAAVVLSVEDGRYEIAGLDPGTYILWAWRGDRGTRRAGLDRRTATVERGRSVEGLDLVLAPGVVLEGRIVEEGTARPIAGAMVGHSGLLFTASGEAGRFRLEGVPAGLADVIASASGFARRSAGVDAAPGESPFLEIPLPRGGVIEGKVVSSGGMPAPGVTVRARGERSSAAARTDAGGRYRLEGIPLTAHGISLRASLCGRLVVEDTISGFPGTEACIARDLRLPEPCVFRGRVVDAASRPVPGAEIRLLGDIAWAACETDGGGRFALEDAPGTEARLLVRKRGYAPASVHLGGIAPEAREAIEVVLEAGHFVAGTVVDRTGAPVEGASVYVGAMDPGSGGWAETDSSGRFRIDDLPLELAETGASKEGFADSRWNAAVADQADARIALDEAGQIQGTVVDAASGLPVRSFVVKVSFADGRFPPGDQFTRADFTSRRKTQGRSFGPGMTPAVADEGLRFHSPDGTFKVRHGLVPGFFYKISVQADGHAESVLNGVKASSLSEDREPIVVALEKGEPLRGRVVAAGTGEALSGVKVTHLSGAEGANGRGSRYWSADRPGEGDVVRVAVTDAKGDFTVPGVPSAPGTLLLERAGLARTSFRGVRPGPELQLFEVSAAASVAGAVRDREGNAVRGASIQVRLGGETFRGGTTDAAGRYRVDGLPAGEGAVTVRRSGAIAKAIAVALAGGQTAVADFLEDPGSLCGNVTEDGRPVPGARVSVTSRAKPGDSASMAADEEGSFRLEDLAPGSYEIRAARPDPLGFLAEKASTVEVGLEEAVVEIALPARGRLAGRVVLPAMDSGMERSPAVELGPAGSGMAASVRLYRRSPELFEGAPVVIPAWEWARSGEADLEGGAFDLEAPGPGTYFLVACREGEAAAWLGPLDIAPSCRLENLTVLGGSCALEIAVLDAGSDSPLAGAEVVLSLAAGQPFSRRSRTGPAGRSIFERIPAGAYRLEARSPEHLSGRDAVELSGSETVARSIRLEPASWMDVDVEGVPADAGKCVLTAAVISGPDPGWAWRSRPGDRPVERRTLEPDALGKASARLEAPPGDYSVRFSVAGEEAGSAPLGLVVEELDVTVPAAGQARVVLRLDGAGGGGAADDGS